MKKLVYVLENDRISVKRRGVIEEMFPHYAVVRWFVGATHEVDEMTLIALSSIADEKWALLDMDEV